MASKPYVVKQGEYLSKLAHRMSFDADTVWNDPQNADLKGIRPNPDILSPGDVLFVPEPTPVLLPITLGGPNKYSATVPTTKVKMIFTQEGKPLANELYYIEGLMVDTTDSTKDDGSISFEAPITMREVSIVFPNKNVSHPVLIGDVDPHEETSGVVTRLANMGYFGWDPEYAGDSEGEDFTDALSAFQQDAGISVTGALDKATHDALRDKHQI